jgi:hypothetical protein
VLGCVGQDKAPFGQGSLVRFRMRMIEHHLDKKLVDRAGEADRQVRLEGAAGRDRGDSISGTASRTNRTHRIHLI